ncbi:MAG: hypothetical protein H7Y42_03035 [Chitinophagaceae bacterium]|nr:hypothetical protein [Chitinophagaceae bacterium]
MSPTKQNVRKVPTRSRRRYVGLTIFIVFLAAIGGGLWYWNSNKKTIIKSKIENAITKKSKGFYQIKYDSLELDEVAGYLSISNMHLRYDSNMYAIAQNMGKAPPVILDIFIPKLSVAGVQTPRALIEDEIVGRTLIIKDPVIDISYTYSGNDAKKNVPTREVYKQILGNLDLIQIDTVLITGAKIKTSSHKTKKSLFQLQDVDITLVNVKVDSAAGVDPSRYLFAKELTASCAGIGWASANKLYNYRTGTIAMSSVTRELTVKSFTIHPNLAEDAFVNSLPTQDDRFDFTLGNIRLSRIDVAKLLEEEVVAETMVVSPATFKIYRDLAIPRDKVNRVGKYPHQVIDEIPIPFRVDKLILSNGFVEYKERNQITRQSGKVQFYNIYATLTNFTNDKKVIASNNLMTAEVSSKFLNKTALKTTWQFYLLHPKGRFNVKGSLGPITAGDLNPLTEPMGPAKIKEGRINGLEFNMEGNDYAADGTVELLYEGLKVSMLEKDKGATETDKKFLMSLLANIVIKNDNPKKNEEVRVAQAHFDRDTNRSIFHLVWKTIFQGIRETVGIKK